MGFLSRLLEGIVLDALGVDPPDETAELRGESDWLDALEIEIDELRARADTAARMADLRAGSSAGSSGGRR